MTARTKLTIEISEQTKNGLDRLAEHAEASSAHLAGEAIAAYVDRELETVRGIETGLSDLAAGRIVPHDAAMAQITASIHAAKAKRS